MKNKFLLSVKHNENKPKADYAQIIWRKIKIQSTIIKNNFKNFIIKEMFLRYAAMLSGETPPSCGTQFENNCHTSPTRLFSSLSPKQNSICGTQEMLTSLTLLKLTTEHKTQLRHDLTQK